LSDFEEQMATAATETTPVTGPTPVKVGTLPVILPELTYPNSTPEEREAVKALLAEPERNSNVQKAKAVAKITLSPLTPNNVGTVRKLNSVSRRSPSFLHLETFVEGSVVQARDLERHLLTLRLFLFSRLGVVPYTV
jgi:hypothetical protein